MRFIAQINIMPLAELLDPPGKAVSNSLHNLGLNSVTNVRIGKHITMHLEATTPQQAEQIANDACRKLLANAVMEKYEFTIIEA